MSKLDHVLAAVLACSLAGCALDDSTPDETTSDVESDVGISRYIWNSYWRQYLHTIGPTDLNLSNSPTLWTIVPTGTPAEYWLKTGNNMCAYVSQTGAGAHVVTTQCPPIDNNTSMDWSEIVLHINGGTYYQFRNRYSHMCLDTIGGTDSGIMQWYCDSPFDPNLNAQTWALR